jgi:predicted nucleotidyltransferase component of viral defense system
VKKDLAASIRARLLLLAKAEGVDFQYILIRYALERLLYRLGQSAHADRFLLKGALLFSLWYDLPHRPTRDADLLGFGPSDLESVAQAFREIVALDVADGIVFDPDTVTVEEIRKDAGYAGARVMIDAEISKARCKTQVDIGFGDAVTPGPVTASYPVLITDFPAPKLRTYPVYTVISEKVHAIALLGMTNSRLKDYFDLWVLLDRESLNIQTLAQAIAATFSRRGLALPENLPVGLTDEFSEDDSRRALWRTFLKKNNLDSLPLDAIVGKLRQTLDPVLARARTMRIE